MKKFLSIMLTTILVFRMSTMALAATKDNEGNFRDESTITITKNYKATNENTTSPAENLTFVVEKVSVEEAGVVDPETGKVVEVTDDDFPMISIEDVTSEDSVVVGIALEEGNASYSEDGTPNTLTINLPEYKAVGIYTYTVKEIANNYAGVTYYSDPITVVVTVIQDGEDQIRIAAVHTEIPKKDTVANGKSDTFENSYSAGTLDVTKTVTGNLGDRTKEFEVTVIFKAPSYKDEEGKDVYKEIAAPIYYDVDEDGEIEEGEVVPEFDVNGEATVTLTLKHDQTITFTNIPYDVTYTVKETDYTSEKYDNAQYVLNSVAQNAPDEDGNIEALSDGVQDKVDSASEKVEIINNKGTTVDTGITLDNIPYMMMLAIAAAGLALFTAKKRRYTED